MSDFFTKKAEESALEQKEFNQKKSALEQALLKTIEGQDADVIHEAILLVMHRLMGSFRFGSHLLGSTYQK